MSASYQFIMTITVFDEELLLQKANEFAQERGIDEKVEFVSDALQWMLDPGGGGDAYAGNLNEIGIQIEDSVVGVA